MYLHVVKKHGLLLMLSLVFLLGLSTGTNAMAPAAKHEAAGPAVKDFFSPAKTGFSQEAIRVSAFQSNGQVQLQQGINKITGHDASVCPYLKAVASSCYYSSPDGLFAKSYLEHIHPYHHFW